MMNKSIKSILASMFFLALSGCMSPVKTGPETGYVINAVPDHIVKTRQRSLAMLVMNPEVSQAYDTKRMAFTMHPYQISYYSQSRWVEDPGNMFSSLIMQTLQKTNHFKAVVTPPFTGSYNYALRTQINSLLIDYTSKSPVFRLSMQATIMSAASGRMISSKDFKAVVPLSCASPYAAVYAANRAAQQVMSDMAVWIVRSTQ